MTATAPCTSVRHQSSMASRNSEGSVIGSVTEITGNVSGNGDLAVEGRISGSVSITGALSIAAAAEVSGPIRASALALDGKLSGDVETTGPISIGGGASYQGVLAGERVTIEAGAEVNAELATDFELKLNI